MPSARARPRSRPPSNPEAHRRVEVFALTDRRKRLPVIDNLKVEKRHAEQWIDMAKGFGVSRDELFSTPVNPEVEALTHWLWSITNRGSFVEAVAAANYAIEGVTQGIATAVIKGFVKYHGRCIAKVLECLGLPVENVPARRAPSKSLTSAATKYSATSCLALRPYLSTFRSELPPTHGRRPRCLRRHDVRASSGVRPSSCRSTDVTRQPARGISHTLHGLPFLG